MFTSCNIKCINLYGLYRLQLNGFKVLFRCWMKYVLVNEYRRFQEQINIFLKQVSETLIPYETKIAELYHLWICNVSHASDFPDPKISKPEKSIQSRSYSNYSTCSYVSLCKKKMPFDSFIHILNYNAGIKSSYDEHSTSSLIICSFDV